MDFKSILSDLEYAQEILAASAYKDTIDDIISLVEKSEKYRWHDLRKDPTDIPKKMEIIGFTVCGEVERIKKVKVNLNFMMVSLEQSGLSKS